MVGVETGPELALQGRDRTCYIQLKAPRVLGEVFGHAVEAIIVESSLISVDKTFYIGVTRITSELPIVQLAHVCL